jgi:hypothetical protein
MAPHELIEIEALVDWITHGNRDRVFRVLPSLFRYVRELEANQAPSRLAGRCPDCGLPGEREGHMESASFPATRPINARPPS